jgi:tRNA pseudouridine32 synthase/23S rRNA pseudouridine746 synthase
MHAAPPISLLDRVLYRDGLMLVIDKPAGIAVHPGPGGGASLEDGFDQLRFGLPRAPALAHRLDRDTSGCLVLGRHPKATRRLGALFAEGRVVKTYWALVHGVPSPHEGVIDRPLAKISENRFWRMKPDANGLPSLTRYRVLASDGETAWLELKPETGRTHQLRSHCEAIGHGILGDTLYGPDAKARGGDTRLQLHARRILIPLYANRPPIDVTAPPPPHMRDALARYGAVEELRSGAVEELRSGAVEGSPPAPSGEGGA